MFEWRAHRGERSAGTSNGPRVCTGEGAGGGEADQLLGGVDPTTGKIIDQRHDRCGETIAGRICFFPAEKGSSTASAVLLELVRIGKAPAAIITAETPPILMLGAMIAQQLYNVTIPVLRITEGDLTEMQDGQHMCISMDGTMECSGLER